MSGQISRSGQVQPEYCFLQLKGVTERELRAEDFSHVTVVVPVSETSVSANALQLLMSPELKRTVALSSATGVSSSSSFKSLQNDLQNASQHVKSEKLDCRHSVEVWKGQLGLVEEEKVMGLGGRWGLTFCVWACVVGGSLSAPPTAGQPWTLPHWPSPVQAKPLWPRSPNYYN